MNGTLVTHFQKPNLFSEGYFDQKVNYSLNLQIINLPNKHIVDYVAGHTDNYHNSATFENSVMLNQARCLFHG